MLQKKCLRSASQIIGTHVHVPTKHFHGTFWCFLVGNANTMRKDQNTSFGKNPPIKFSARMACTGPIFGMQIADVHFPWARWFFFAIDDDFGRNREITDFLWIFRFKMDVFSGTDGKTAQNGCAEKKLEEISPLEQYVKNLQHALCFAKKSFSSLFGVLGVFFVICLLNHGTTRLSSKYPNLEMIWEKWRWISSNENKIGDVTVWE